MIDKIVHVKNIGRFLNYNASGDVSLRKLSLIYAENGRGKTTLCAILRSLQTGKSEYISERKALACTDSPGVYVRIDNDSYEYSDGNWSHTYRNLAIFDPVFINENVCSGDYVEHDHKKNLYRVIVGSEGVRLARRIEELDKQIRDVNTSLRTKRESISSFMPQGIELDEYLEWQPQDGIDNQIQQKNDELIRERQLVSRASEIQSKGSLRTISLPNVPSTFETVLNKQLSDIVADAERKVRQQIARHEMPARGESWLSDGVGFIKDSLCPFCGQSVDANELIDAYRSHFSASYRDLKQEVSMLSRAIESAIGDRSLATIQEIISQNAALSEFWRQFFEFTLPEISFALIQKKFTALRRQCLALATAKENRPTDSVPLSDEYREMLNGILELAPIISSYNTAIESVNVKIAEQKDSSASGENVSRLTAEIAGLAAKKRRFETEVVNTCQEYTDTLGNKAELEQAKESARRGLDSYCESIIATYEQSINEYLDLFNAGFRITNARHLYTGGTPSSQYKIQINGVALELGDLRTPAGTPCFKTALSSGDRSALALAFFLATLKHDPDIADKIVVFDDPFTSLDRFRRTCTQQLIQKLAQEANQVIVLSHDPYFLSLLWNECPNRDQNVKALQMSKAGNTTVLGEWDVEAETQSTYMKDHSTLLAFYRDRIGDLRSVARTIRPFLEGLLRVRFPGHFQPNEWLGDFIGKIRDAECTSGLQHAKQDLNELEAINAYSKKYHHQQNANADSEPINDDELHGFVKRTLRLVGGE
jgi:wobble nucleotide-excising tRNase